jgi:hypothetical protein
MRQFACALVVAVTLGPAVPALAAKAASPPSKQELEAARKLLERYVPEAANRPTLWSAMAAAALLEGQPAIGQAAMERAALVFGGGDLQSLGKAVARTWLGAAKELLGDPVSRDSRASFILLYIETALHYDPYLARQEEDLVAEAPKKLAAAKESPQPGVPTEADLKVVVDREVLELERSMEKAKVRRTEGDIRTLSTAIEAYAIDKSKYPAGTLDELEKLLSPTYVRAMPRVDAWGTPFRVEVSNDRHNYRITSAGADRTFEKRGPLGCPEDKGAPVELSDPRRDLVFFSGRFVQSVR